MWKRDSTDRLDALVSKAYPYVCLSMKQYLDNCVVINSVHCHRLLGRVKDKNPMNYGLVDTGNPDLDADRTRWLREELGKDARSPCGRMKV